VCKRRGGKREEGTAQITRIEVTKRKGLPFAGKKKPYQATWEKKEKTKVAWRSKESIDGPLSEEVTVTANSGTWCDEGGRKWKKKKSCEVGSKANLIKKLWGPYREKGEVCLTHPGLQVDPPFGIFLGFWFWFRGALRLSSWGGTRPLSRPWTQRRSTTTRASNTNQSCTYVKDGIRQTKNDSCKKTNTDHI